MKFIVFCLVLSFISWCVGNYCTTYQWIKCAERGDWVRIKPLFGYIRIFRITEVTYEEVEGAIERQVEKHEEKGKDKSA